MYQRQEKSRGQKIGMRDRKKAYFLALLSGRNVIRASDRPGRERLARRGPGSREAPRARPDNGYRDVYKKIWGVK